MAQKTDTRTQLLTASPFQLMISLSLPAIIGMVVVGLYSFMDRVFVGHWRRVGFCLVQSGGKEGPENY